MDEMMANMSAHLIPYIRFIFSFYAFICALVFKIILLAKVPHQPSILQHTFHGYYLCHITNNNHALVVGSFGILKWSCFSILLFIESYGAGAVHFNDWTDENLKKGSLLHEALAIIGFRKG